MKRKLIKIALIVAVIALPAVIMTFQVVSTPTIDCEVCMEFRGLSKCRSARGPDNEECRRTAADNACAFLASGMTDSIACTQREPVRVTFGKSAEPL